MVFPAQNPIPQTWEVLSRGGKVSPQDQTMLSILRNAYKLSSNSFTVLSATMSLCVMRTIHYLKQHGHKLSINRRGRYMLRRLLFTLGQQVLLPNALPYLLILILHSGFCLRPIVPLP
jgi:hypothetical protein